MKTNHEGSQMANALEQVAAKIETRVVPESISLNLEDELLYHWVVLDLQFIRRMLTAFKVEENVTKALPVEFTRMKCGGRLLLAIYLNQRDVYMTIASEPTGSFKGLRATMGIEVPLATVHKVIADRDAEDASLLGAGEQLLIRTVAECLRPAAERERRHQEERRGHVRTSAKSAPVEKEKSESAPKSGQRTERDSRGLPEGCDSRSLKLLDADLVSLLEEGVPHRFAFWEKQGGIVSAVYVDAAFQDGMVTLTCAGADGKFMEEYKQFHGISIGHVKFLMVANGLDEGSDDLASRFAALLGSALVALKTRLAARNVRKGDNAAAAVPAAQAS